MSDTPETDAVEEADYDPVSLMTATNEKLDAALDLARRLERERDQAREFAEGRRNMVGNSWKDDPFPWEEQP